MRRPTLRTILLTATAALVLAAAGTLAVLWPRDREPFHGPHQSGITTAPQKFAFVAAFDVTAADAAGLRSLLKAWTAAAGALADGRPVGTGDPRGAPPADTGEVLGRSPARLTLTFGAGPSLFDGRFGLSALRPAALADLPDFPGDSLNPGWSDGDLVVQAAADDYQSAYHAVHNLARIAKGRAVLRWVQAGFQGPRNLQGFLDGTVNPDPSDPAAMDRTVWAAGPQWLQGGSYLVVRRIRMFVEVWDRSSLGDQERTIGRDRAAGEPLAAQAEDSHVRLARGAGVEKILRRPFHYVNGLDPLTGQWDSGLLFLAWMKDPRLQFVPMQTRLSSFDRLNEYIRTVGSGVYAVFPGVSPGSYLGASLVPEPPLVTRIEGLQGALGALYPALAREDWTALRAGAGAWGAQWEDLRAEAGPRAPEIGTLGSRWTGAVNEARPDPAAVRRAQTDLVKALELWRTAAVPQATDTAAGLAALKAAAYQVERDLASGGPEAARKAFGAYLREWTARETLVRNLDPSAYGALEAQSGAVRRALQDGAGAAGPVRDLAARVGALEAPRAFTAWDAGFLLFREGLEALLVLAALLAYLGKAGLPGARPWVWAGTAGGVAASLAVAALVAAVSSGWASASAPELVEGLTGLAAVVLMLVVGSWLHRKAAVKNWNLWLKDRMGRGADRPWALGLLAFLAVLREGAETVVFFWGLAGSLGPADLAAGIGGALVVLAALGVLLIGFSKRLPLGWFFLLATALISYLAVKVLGQSLWSLQAYGWVSSTPLGFGTPVDFLGFHPTWETALPQLVLGLALTAVLAAPMVGGKKKNPPPPAT